MGLSSTRFISPKSHHTPLLLAPPLLPSFPLPTPTPKENTAQRLTSTKHTSLTPQPHRCRPLPLPFPRLSFPFPDLRSLLRLRCRLSWYESDLRDEVDVREYRSRSPSLPLFPFAFPLDLREEGW